MPKSFAVLTLIIMLVVPIVALPQPAPTQQEFASRPADLLPGNTLAYFELAGSDLSDVLTNLLTEFAPNPDRLPPSGLLLAATPYLRIAPWIGDSIAGGVFPVFDLDDPQFRELMPGFALILQVRNERLADFFIQQRLDESDFDIDPLLAGVARYRNQDGGLIPIDMLRLPGFVVLGSPAGVDEVQAILEDPNAPTLAENTNFANYDRALAPDAFLKGYLIGGNGVAAMADEEAFTVDTISTGRPSDRLPRPFGSDVLEAIPIAPLVVITGSDANAGLRSTLDTIDDVLDVLDDIGLTDDASRSLQDAFAIFTGVPLDNLVSLLDGQYAVYASYSRGTIYETLGLPIDAGLLAAPDDPRRAAETVVVLTNTLEDTGLNIANPESGIFEIITGVDALPEIVYGSSGERFFISTQSGAERTIRALTAGNLTTDQRWQRVVENAPDDTQQIAYLNMSALAALSAEGLGFDFLNTQLVRDIIEYLLRFESAAIYTSERPNGQTITRLSIIYD